MTECAVEVGPGTVRGPCDADQDLVSTALEYIDDEIALLDDQPVSVAALWRAVFRSVLPDHVGTAALVCPTWWPSSRVTRVQEAAATVATKVIVLQRAKVLAGDAPVTPTVVEIAPEFVVVSRAGLVCDRGAAPREIRRHRQGGGGWHRCRRHGADRRAGRRRRCLRAGRRDLRVPSGRRRRRRRGFIRTGYWSQYAIRRRRGCEQPSRRDE